jgi:hypothetical protein
MPYRQDVKHYITNIICVPRPRPYRYPAATRSLKPGQTDRILAWRKSSRRRLGLYRILDPAEAYLDRDKGGDLHLTVLQGGGVHEAGRWARVSLSPVFMLLPPSPSTFRSDAACRTKPRIRARTGSAGGIEKCLNNVWPSINGRRMGIELALFAALF